jgi:hypothetical protein
MKLFMFVNVILTKVLIGNVSSEKDYSYMRVREKNINHLIQIKG